MLSFMMRWYGTAARQWLMFLVMMGSVALVAYTVDDRFWKNLIAAVIILLIAPPLVHAAISDVIRSLRELRSEALRTQDSKRRRR